MARNPSEVEQAVSRTLRDSLAKLQQTSGELNQAVNDLVSACASTRASNSLPPMLRARSAAASLAASLEVLSKFVIAALQSMPALAEEDLLAPAPRTAAPVASPLLEPIESVAPAEPVAPAMSAAPAVSVAPDMLVAAAAPVEPIEVAEPVERVELEPAAPALPAEPTLVASSPAELPPTEVAPPLAEAVVEPPPAQVQEPQRAPEPVWASEPTAAVVDEELSRVAELSSADPSTPALSPASYNEELPPEAVGFDVLALTPEERELHRRANRVAKVSMQDVKMLRPVDVALGREHKDICNTFAG